jgi:hypothetical protein
MVTLSRQNSSGIKGILINKIDLENKFSESATNIISLVKQNGELAIEMVL